MRSTITELLYRLLRRRVSRFRINCFLEDLPVDIGFALLMLAAACPT